MMSSSAAKRPPDEGLDLIEAPQNRNASGELRDFRSVLQIRDHRPPITQRELDLAARSPGAGQCDENVCAQNVDVIARSKRGAVPPAQMQMRPDGNLDPRVWVSRRRLCATGVSGGQDTDDAARSS